MAIGIRGFAAIIAVAALMVIGVACGNGAEPTSLNEEAPTQAPPTVGGITPGVQPVPASMGTPAPSMSPAAGSTSEPLLLTFDGVEYTAVEWLSAASPNGPIVCCGTPINMDDMEVVGTGTRNTDADTSVEVYRPKAGATTDVYIFHPATTVENRKPGGPPPSPARLAQWVRWTTDVAPPAPAADPRLTFEGVEYTGVMILGALNPTGVCVEHNEDKHAETPLAIVTPCATPINMDDMEVVGIGTDHDPFNGDASVEVYRPKAGATTDVLYAKDRWVLHGWFRWTAKINKGKVPF